MAPAAPPQQPITPTLPSAVSRSPPAHPQSHPPSALSLGLLPLPLPLLPAPVTRHPAGSDTVEHVALPVAKVKLADIVPYDGAPGGVYSKAVEELSGSLMRHNAVVIELGSEEAVVVKCALESARLCFKARAQCNGAGSGVTGWGKLGRGVYTYRAGR
ncbi:hypothetical protein BHE74_00003129 [Ensete ventricosum]|nr:hypothetical protein BHE74_00003129 [Ensete ventricosum]